MSSLSIGDKLIMNTDITVGGGEVKTGATWNGRPVYARCDEASVTWTSGTNVFLFTAIPNIDKAVAFKSMLIQSAFQANIPYLYASGGSVVEYIADVMETDGRVRYNYVFNAAGKIRCYRWYTKTTD